MSESGTDEYDAWVNRVLGYDIIARRNANREQTQSEGRARSNSFTLGEKRGAPSKEEAAYLKRRGEVTQHAKSLEAQDAKLPEGVTAKLQEATGLAVRRNYTQAITSLEAADLLVTQAQEELAALKDIKKEYASIGPQVRQQTKAGDTDPPWFAEAIKPAEALLGTISRGLYGNERLSSAELADPLEKLKALMPSVSNADGVRNSYADYMAKTRPEVASALVIKPGSDQGIARVQQELREADTALSTAATLEQTKDLLKSATEKLKQVQDLSTARVSDLARSNTKKSDVRKKVVDFMKDDPGILKRLAETPDGRAVLDGLMNDIGKTAKGKTDNSFVLGALEARFGAKFTGDLENSAGPRLYSVFKMVPDEHTRGNDKIAEVKRNKNYKPTSWYGADEDEDEGVGAHHIVLNAVRTGGIKGWIVDTVAGGDNFLTHGAQKYQNVKGGKKLNAFDHVTLHEIGHGVDEMEGFMESHGKDPKFGGWESRTVDQVADAIGNGMGFYTQFKAQPAAFLKTYLLSALSKGFNPAKLKEHGKAATMVTKESLLGDAGVKEAEAKRNLTVGTLKKRKQDALKKIALTGHGKKLAQAAIEEIMGGTSAETVVDRLMALKPGPNLDWTALEKHEAVKRCTEIKLSGSENGLWEKGDKAGGFAVGGLVYQQSYADNWCSYDPTALTGRVTNYQFRSPSEWFADAYACYFLGKLPDNHPLASWLAEQGAPEE